MPGGAHLAILAARTVIGQNRFIVIGNGLSTAEEKWLGKNLFGIEMISTHQVLDHHYILDSLFSVWKENFAIMDYDCFIINSQLQSELFKVNSSEICSSVFFENKNPANLKMPETFLVYFNIELVKHIFSKWGVGSNIYRWPDLPISANHQLKKFLFNDNGYPDYQKNYFDTLRVIFLLAHLEGYKFRIIRNYESFHGKADEVFHVGAVSKPTIFSNGYSYAGSYFWSETIRAFNDTELIQIAKNRYGGNVFEVIDQSYERFADDIKPEVVEFTKRFCSDIR